MFNWMLIIYVFTAEIGIIICIFRLFKKISREAFVWNMRIVCSGHAIGGVLCFLTYEPNKYTYYVLLFIDILLVVLSLFSEALIKIKFDFDIKDLKIQDEWKNLISKLQNRLLSFHQSIVSNWKLIMHR